MRTDQHFLIDMRVVESLVKGANLCRDNVALDVGAGRGVITERDLLN